MTLVEYITAIVLSLALRHGHTDQARLRAAASDIVDAATSYPALCGGEAVQATALMLVSVAEHESGWHPAVQDCTCARLKMPCGSGRSWTLFQLEGPAAFGAYTRAELCSNVYLSASRAALVLRHYRGRSSHARLFAGYATGGNGPSKAGDEIATIYGGMLRRAGLAVVYRRGCLTAERI
jgi:hypothetical protein